MHIYIYMCTCIYLCAYVQIYIVLSLHAGVILRLRVLRLDEHSLCVLCRGNDEMLMCAKASRRDDIMNEQSSALFMHWGEI